MAVDLFAGMPVDDFKAALTWYERLLGSPPEFFAHETEAVWKLDEQRWLYVVRRPEHAGHGMVTIFVEDLDAFVASATGQGVEPAKRETYPGDVHKVTYHDPDGNEVDFGGGAPL